MTVDTIGRYKIDRTVGEGAYGTVFRALDPTLDRAVAVKLMKPDVRDAKGPEDSLEEAKTLAKLNHPNIVTLYEVLHEAGQSALVMEFIEGEALGEYISRVQPDLTERLTIARQIADALAEAHSHGIVHADIKPGNVLVKPDSRPVVVDFGLSKAVPQSSEMATLTGGSVGQNMILGTLCYMAPEVMKGGKPDEKSDIFSFGALFYELLTGERAFKAPSDAETVNLILNVDPVPVSAHQPTIPAWCANLAARMLAKDVEGRPASFSDVVKAIDSGDAGTPVRDRTADTPRPRRLVTGKRIAMALLIMIAVVGGFLGAQFYGGEPMTVSSRINAGLENLRYSYRKGAIEEAKAQFQSVLAEDPENAAATAGYSLALHSEYSDIEQDPLILKNAEASAQLARNLDDQLSLAHVAIGWAKEFVGELNQASQSFSSALLLEPNNYFALFGASRIPFKMGRFDEAIEAFELALESFPDDPTLLVYLGDSYFRMGEYDKAEAQIQHAISVEPDYVYAYRTLGAILYAQGRTIDAITVTQRGLTVRPESMLYNNLGTFYYALGQYPQSVKAFERAVDTDGNSHSYFHWANLGDAYSMVPDGQQKAQVAYKRAIQLLSGGMSEDDVRPNVLSRAGLYYAKAADTLEALNMTKRALELAPDDRWVLFRAAVVNDLAGDREKALTLLRKALDAGQPLIDIQNEPYLSALREDPRYHRMLAEKNLN